MTATLNGTNLIDSLVEMIKSVSPTKEGLRTIVEEIVDERVPRTVIMKSPDNKQLGKIEGHRRNDYEKIARAVFSGVNVMLIGPAGSGKTHLAEQIAKDLGLDFGFVSLTGGASESKLVGRFVPTGENGKFEYVPATFVRMYETGGLFLLDEMDAADPNMMMCINSALANGQMETPNPNKPVVKRHELFRCVAAMNTFGTGACRQYVGRNQLDASTLDRFAMAKFEIGYDEGFERQAGNPEVVRWAHILRQQIETHKIRRIISTRGILAATNLIGCGFTLAEVKNNYFLDWTQAERNMVN